ncbi:MAG TPA: glutamyl-tRNA reductase [Candidatus Dormibacteraeota bacterium]|nr:glutamyl-tRNA reductase [Candidatus Dormibacteraeota bacterium]
MPSESSKIIEVSEPARETEEILNLRFTYKKATLPFLNVVTFKDPCRAQKKILTRCNLKECVILQTCNRVEIFAVIRSSEFCGTYESIAECWRLEVKLSPTAFYSGLESSSGYETLTHLFRLASGLESMIVGEDQILGQVQDALKESEQQGLAGPILRRAFDRAIKTGTKIRIRTGLNKGAVSIGSAAANLLEQLLGSLEGKKIIVIGAGQTGMLVGKALAVRKPRVIYVANRTYHMGVRLAKMLGGQAVRLDGIRDYLADVDVIIVATSAPHIVLTTELIADALRNRGGKELLIVDLSQPSNVEESVKTLPNIHLRNIDDLRRIAEGNLKMRLAEVKDAEAIINSELERFELQCRRERVEPLISVICQWAENMRQQELTRALKMIGDIDHEHTKVLEDMTRSLLERILFHPISTLRRAAVTGNDQIVSTVEELFDTRLDQNALQYLTRNSNERIAAWPEYQRADA